ncbi:MAG: serine/threonine protein kinase, bacterial [Acidimicrobiaceae bacterium]|jgi:serine/threonine protein kinase
MPVIGQYSLEQLLSSNAEANVWRGRCHRPVDRSVAVKQVLPRDPDDAARLLEEVTTLLALDHPHVVRVLEVLDGEDGVIVVMQYAPGGSLAELLAERRCLDAGETVAIAAPLADALASAHRHGIVHGDVKPANVLFTSDGEPLLADFGGGMRGTDGYIAPEVAAGATVDERADVYALGVVCREALGGDVPDELASVLDAAVAPNPNDRPANATELARLLRAAVPGDSVRLPRPALGAARVLGPPTRLFGPRPPARSIARRARSKSPLLLIPLLLLAAFAWVRQGSARRTAEPVACAGAPIPVPAGAQIVRADTAGIGCLATGVYASGVLTIRLQPTDPRPRRFALGLPGDRIFLGDWDCDGAASPALFRPSTGATLYYDTWSAIETPSDNANRCRSIG